MYEESGTATLRDSFLDGRPATAVTFLCEPSLSCRILSCPVWHAPQKYTKYTLQHPTYLSVSLCSVPEPST